MTRNSLDTRFVNSGTKVTQKRVQLTHQSIYQPPINMTDLVNLQAMTIQGQKILHVPFWKKALPTWKVETKVMPVAPGWRRSNSCLSLFRSGDEIIAPRRYLWRYIPLIQSICEYLFHLDVILRIYTCSMKRRS